jgi:hypothetical protein
MTPAKSLSSCCALLLGFAVWTLSPKAHADTLTINRPGQHPAYVFEAEPHLLLGFIDPPGLGHGFGVGAGFRGTVELVDNGFVPSINNTVGIGFGIDWVSYERDKCARVRGPGEYDCSDGVSDIWIPVVMQWNFWLSQNWSVFGEPGLSLRIESADDDTELNVDPLHFHAGGRFHFADMATLTMRVGYPTFSVGVSFLL